MAAVAAYYTFGASEAYFGSEGAFVAAGAAGSGTYTAESGGTPGQVLQSAVAGGLLAYGGYNLVYGAAGWDSLMSSGALPYDFAAADGLYGAASAANNGGDLQSIETNAFFHGLQGYGIGTLVEGGINIATDIKNAPAGSLSWSSTIKTISPYMTVNNTIWASENASLFLGTSWLANDLGQDMGLSHTAAWDLSKLIGFYVNYGSLPDQPSGNP